MAAPPFFKLEKSWRLSVDIGPEMIVLGSEAFGRIRVVETANQVAAIEFPTTDVTG